MTANQQPRRLRRQAGEGSRSGGSASAGQSISERLRAAREARGIDLFRVERDTKIRIKYLVAMELGQFEELPADVYARGFLRNYASYLGLDPDEAETEWRNGNGAAPPSGPAVEPPALPPISYQSPVFHAPTFEVPPFKVPDFKFPALKWPITTKPAGEPIVAPAAAKPAPGGRKSAPTSKPAPVASKAAQAAAKQAIAAANVSPTQMPVLAPSPWNRPSFSLRIPAFLQRRESDKAVEPFIGGPQPLTMPGRSLLLQPTHVVLLLLAVVILAVALFFGLQATRVLQDPTLTVSAPAQALENRPTGTTTYALKGKATSKAEISIRWDNRDPMHTQADAAGNWAFQVTLHNGNNQFDIWSTDLNTNHDSAIVSRVINVLTPTASPVPLFLAVNSPLDGAGFRDGSFVVTGTVVAVTSVTVTPIYLGPAPSDLPTPKPIKTAGPVPTAQATLQPLATETPLIAFLSPTPSPRPTPAPNASNAPTPVQVIPTIDGKFSAQMHLWSGRWKLSVVGANAQGLATKPVEVNVIVTAGSLIVVIDIRGGPVDLRIWRDGKVVSGYTPYIQYKSGKQVKIVADQSVWIFTGVAKYTYVTVNGVPLGRLGPTNNPGSWRITAFGPPTPSNDR